MKVLELFCGMGGWSKGFAEMGHECTGIDIINLDYPYRFIKADLFDWEPDQHYDIVVASPPCTEFSVAKKWGCGWQDERQGLDLVYRTFYLIEKIKPKYWLIENVKGLAEFLPPPTNSVRYIKHAGGKTACLWGNFGKLGFIPEMLSYKKHDSKDEHGKRIQGAKKTERGLIPIQLSRVVAQAMTQ
jgi:hypothetical protein